VSESAVAEEAPSGWGPARVAGGLAVLLGLTVVEVGVVAAFDPDLETLGARLAVQAVLAVTLVAVAFTVASPGPGSVPAGALGLVRPRRPALSLAVGGYLAYLGFSFLWSLLVSPEQEDITRELGLHESAVGAVVAGLLIVVAAPVSEEIFFRGFMFGGIRSRLPFWVAAAVSGAIFGLFHYTGSDSLGVVPQLAFLGMMLAWLYERTGSILPAIGIHALNNAFAFAILAS
jgi:uncharacterized protein